MAFPAGDGRLTKKGSILAFFSTCWRFKGQILILAHERYVRYGRYGSIDLF